MRNPYHKSMHRSRVIPVFECIVPTFCQILKIAKALDFTAFQRFNRPIGRTICPRNLTVSGFLCAPYVFQANQTICIKHASGTAAD